MSVEEPSEPASRVVVTGGGEVSPEELAAIVVALTPTGGGEPAIAAGPRPSAWREAGLLEGVGFRPFVSVDDVERYHRSLA